MTPDNLITILSLTALILYGISQLFYNKHYRDAKQAELGAKDSEIDNKQAEIDSLRSQIPSFMADQNKAVIDMADQNHERLTALVEELQAEIARTTQDKASCEETLLRVQTTARYLKQHLDKTQQDYARLESNAARLRTLFQGAVHRTGPVTMTLSPKTPKVT